MGIGKSMGWFVMAGLCEIAGGYLVWQWLREGKSLAYAGLGALMFFLYGVVPTVQPAHVGRVYARVTGCGGLEVF